MSAQSLWAANALWAGDMIVARLKASVPALREVLAIDEFDPGTTQPRQLPAAVVLLQAMRPMGVNAMRKEVVVEQDWIVALAVRSAARDANANGAEAGALIPGIVSALQGWVPFGTNRGFAWRPGPAPNYGKDVSYFPFLFTLQVVTA